MVKSTQDFSNNYKQSENREKIIEIELEKNGFKTLAFDIKSEFEKCNKDCPIKIKHGGKSIPYSRWVLFNQITRPDILIKYNQPLLIEVKHKNKSFLWVNARDYQDYIKWEETTLIPVYIILFVQNENCYYAHKLQIDTSKLKTFVTKHDGNKVYDLKNQAIKIGNINKLVDFLKQRSL